MLVYRQNADIAVTDIEGRSAFHWAMKTPQINVLRCLCQYASDNEVVNQCVRN